MRNETGLGGEAKAWLRSWSEFCFPKSEKLVRAFSFGAEREISLFRLIRKIDKTAKQDQGHGMPIFTHEIMVPLTLELRACVGTIMTSPTCKG